MAAIVVRLVFALSVASDLPIGIDADYYRSTADSLVDGEGLAWDPAETMWGARGSSVGHVIATDHPPGHTLVLAAGNVVGLTSWDQHRMLLAVLGAGGVAATGLLGRRVGGWAVGWVALAIAAFHPLWFQAAGFSASEATAFAVLPVALLALHVACERTAPAWAVVAGLAAGFSALTMSQAILIALCVPVALLISWRGRRGVGLALVAMLASASLVAPWMWWMHDKTGEWTMSTNGGLTLAGSNCESAYHGPRLGSYGDCSLGIAAMLRMQVPQHLDVGHKAGWVDGKAMEEGQKYARANLDRLPVVLAARAGRTAGLFRIEHSIDFDRTIGAHEPTQRVGYFVHFGILLLAVPGLVLVARKRRIADAAVFVAALSVPIAAGVGVYGATRMRLSMEPVLAVLAAVAIVAVVRRWQTRGRSMDGWETAEQA